MTGWFTSALQTPAKKKNASDSPINHAPAGSPQRFLLSHHTSLDIKLNQPIEDFFLKSSNTIISFMMSRVVPDPPSSIQNSKFIVIATIIAKDGKISELKQHLISIRDLAISSQESGTLT